MLYGTAVTSLEAMLIALPLGDLVEGGVSAWVPPLQDGPFASNRL